MPEWGSLGATTTATARADILVNALGRQGYWLYRNVGGAFETASERTGLGRARGVALGLGHGPRRLRQ